MYTYTLLAKTCAKVLHYRRTRCWISLRCGWKCFGVLFWISCIAVMIFVAFWIWLFLSNLPFVLAIFFFFGDLMRACRRGDRWIRQGSVFQCCIFRFVRVDLRIVMGSVYVFYNLTEWFIKYYYIIQQL